MKSHRHVVIKIFMMSLALSGLSTSIPAQYEKSSKLPTRATSLGDTHKDESVIAIVNGETIKSIELDTLLAAQLKSLEQKGFELRRAGLESLLEKRLFKQEAEGQRLTEAGLWSHLTSEVVVTEGEVEAIYYSKIAQLGAPGNELEAKERIRATCRKTRWYAMRIW